MSKQTTDEDTEVLVREIMRYFEAHPNASDSVQGIAKWWLRHQRYVETTEKVERALNRLVEEGKLQRIHSPDSTVIYIKKRPSADETHPTAGSDA